MGRLGIPVFCYNFMAQFNWVRTSVSTPTRGGALVTSYDHDLMKNAPLTEAGIVTEAKLWDNLQYCLERIIPVAEQSNVKLALHPCDPPVSPIRGIGRIITSAEALKRAVDLVPSDCSGVTLCQGTLAAAGESIPDVIRELGERNKIFFAHFRDVRGTAQKFTETFHDDGQTDMRAAIQAYRDCGYEGPIRVDHVPTMDGESNREPGYETVGRIFALGYLKGLMENVGINNRSEM
jgi:mannonate dehydratase